ncbi:MAG: ParA family protein [Thermodesulfobacteriota bacterium]
MIGKTGPMAQKPAITTIRNPVQQGHGKSIPTPPHTKIVAFANFKGGVGKTACAVSIAGCLAYQFRKRVLLIDLDVQSSLGQWLFGSQLWWNRSRHWAGTSYQVFQDIISGTHLWNVHDSSFDLDSCPNLRVCPATYDMVDLDAQLHYSLNKPSHPKPFQCLDIVIKPWCHGFDYVLLDCPPNMLQVTRNALYCADYVLIPTVPDFLSTAGIKRLVEHIRGLRDQFLLFDTDPVKIGGIIVSMYEMTKASTMDPFVGEIDAYLAEQKSYNHVFTEKSEVFPQKIRRLSAVAQAQERSLPVTIAFPNSEASRDVIQLTHRIMEVV